MAAIDKIYADAWEYKKFKAWLDDNNDLCVKETGDSARDMLFDRDDVFKDNPTAQLSISSFPEVIDKWLLKRCPLSFITDKIKSQYGLDRTKRKPKYRNRRLR